MRLTKCAKEIAVLQMQRTQERKEFHFLQFINLRSPFPSSSSSSSSNRRENTFFAGLLHFTDRESPGSCLTLHSMGNLKRNEGDSKQMHNLRQHMMGNGETRATTRRILIFRRVQKVFELFTVWFDDWLLRLFICYVWLAIQSGDIYFSGFIIFEQLPQQ